MNKQDKEKILLAQAFKKKSRIECKTRVVFPSSFEREYLRIALEAMGIYEDILNHYKPQIEAIIEMNLDARGRDTLDGILKRILDDYGVRINFKILTRRLKKLVHGLYWHDARDWNRAVRKTIGVNIKDDYFKGLKYERMLDVWARKNADLIVRLPERSIDRVKDIIQKSYGTGDSLKQVERKLMSSLGIEERYAKFLAVDQIGKINCDITKMQQTGCGVKSYVWSTSKDSRVRKSHRKLHGKTFDWDNPPVVDEKTGRRCHPQQDYRCRCVAIPVFEKSSLNIPVSAVDWDKIDNDTKEILERGNRYGR